MRPPRFTVLTLVFGRPEAVRALTPFQIDTRHRLVALNASDRRQTRKYRATLPMPDNLWPALIAWRDAPWIVHNRGRRVRVLRKPWAAVRAAAGLPDTVRPKSLRHMLATELRRRKVDREERETWQGHRRGRTNDRYGRYDPEFLASAKQAVGDLLEDLQSACQRPLFPPSFRQDGTLRTTDAGGEMR